LIFKIVTKILFGQCTFNKKQSNNRLEGFTDQLTTKKEKEKKAETYTARIKWEGSYQSPGKY